MPTAQQIDALLPYLAVFEAERFSPGKWSEPMDVLGLFLFDDRVSEFVETLYDQGWIDSAFDWTEWDARHEFAEQPEKIDSADARTIQKLFTAHVRADRFCEGHLAGLFESGVIVRMLQRLRELREGDLTPRMTL